jgi:hypothetical protein
MEDRDIEAAVNREVIALSARSAVVAHIATHFAAFLPIESREQLRNILDAGGPLRLGDAEVPVTEVACHLPANLFPVPDARDLVRKLDAAVGLAIFAGQHGLASPFPETNKLAQLIVRQATLGDPVPVIVSARPPLFSPAEGRST